MQVYLEPPKDLKCTDYRDAEGNPRPMSEVCRTCRDWITIEGKHPLNGRQMFGYQCAQVARVLLQLETVGTIREMNGDLSKKLNGIASRIDHATRVQVAIAEGAHLPPPPAPLMLEEATQ